MTDVTRKCSECNGPVYLFGPEHVCVAPAPTASARDLAVEIVDAVHGYTMEYSHSPVNHRHDYDFVERKLEAYASSQSEKDAAEIERLSKQWETWGIIEIAVRNPNVASYMEHWEKRAEAAESTLSQLQQLDSPLPLKDVLSQLADAADHLLNGHDCDNHGWEEVREAAKKGREIVAILNGGQQ